METKQIFIILHLFACITLRPIPDHKHLKGRMDLFHFCILSALYSAHH